ncbi:MAG: hypothetical protein ACM3SY_10930 [Candidatus Omnitrophota bacterium]
MKKIVVLMIVMAVWMGGQLSAANKTFIDKPGPKVSIAQKGLKATSGIQTAAENEGDIVFLTSYITNDRNEVGNCIALNSTTGITFHTEYVSYAPKKVRFHYIWAGPEFYIHSTDWMDVGYYEYNTLSVTSGPDWIPGTYKLVVMVEHEYGAGSGMQTIAESRIVFY